MKGKLLTSIVLFSLVNSGFAFEVKNGKFLGHTEEANGKISLIKFIETNKKINRLAGIKKSLPHSEVDESINVSSHVYPATAIINQASEINGYQSITLHNGTTQNHVYKIMTEFCVYTAMKDGLASVSDCSVSTDEYSLGVDGYLGVYRVPHVSVTLSNVDYAFATMITTVVRDNGTLYSTDSDAEINLS